MIKLLQIVLVSVILVDCGKKKNTTSQSDPKKQEKIEKYYNILQSARSEEVEEEFLELIKKSEPEIFKKLSKVTELDKKSDGLVDQLKETTNKSDCENLKAQFRKTVDDIDIIVYGEKVSRAGGILVYPCKETGFDTTAKPPFYE